MAHETCKTLSKNSSTNMWYQSLWPVSSALSASGFPILDFCLKALVHMEPCCGMPCLEAQPLRCHLWQCFSQRKIQGQIVYVVMCRSGSLTAIHPSSKVPGFSLSGSYIVACSKGITSSPKIAAVMLPKGLALTWATLTS